MLTAARDAGATKAALEKAGLAEPQAQDARLIDADDSTILTPEGAEHFQYRGNSVAHWIVRAEARGKAIDRAWKAMARAGHPPDGKTPLDEAINAAMGKR
jgi:hypothetical protein